MRNMLSVVVLAAAIAPAQTFLTLPASTGVASAELPDYNLRPFMQTNARVQMFFSATEVGATSFTVTHMSLRYDGPIPQVGAPGPFTIQRLQVHVGTSTVALPGAKFANNTPQPLTAAFDAPFSYLPDPGTAAPHPWGDPQGTLTIPFSTPATVTIPANGWLVIDLQMEGNNIANFGFSHAIVDGIRTTGGATTGTASSFGQGCSLNGTAPAATMTTTGTYAPGAAHFVGGQNLGVNTVVFALAGLDNGNSAFGPLPFTLPNTSCSLLTSADLIWFLQSDSLGSIAANQQAAALAVPPVIAFAGMNLYEQLVAFAPGANIFDLISTDARAVTLGTLQTPGIGIYTVSHGGLADATIADKVDPFGYAVRLQIQ